MFRSLIAFCLSRRAIVVFGLLLFAGAGLVAFRDLNIEAYPNPTPVILEITAQAPGLSAEEMERYYTRPMEIALYTTPGIDVIRSTSFYGLSFVRVVFKYGVDFHFAYAQAAIALQQNVSLPGGIIPTIQQNSTTGEIFRYQVTGPKDFGVTNLRTVQDWIVRRRLLTIPGIVQVNSWGGPTKQFEVEVDPRRLEGFNLTLAQVVSALGNANLNVGGREIRIGQQSINIRGLGLIDDGGSDDLTAGNRLDDIRQVVLTQSHGVPVQVRDVASVSVGYVPRLGIWGHDDEDDAVAGIVVMGRTEKTADMLPKVKREIELMNHDGSLPAGVRLVPIYDRGSLVEVTTHTVLHNLAFGCLLVFLVQWIFLGDLRSAVLVGLNIPFALLFAIIVLVVRGESANLLSLGAVDFGIIVESAVILVENLFRNLQAPAASRRNLLEQLSAGTWGADPTAAASGKSAAAWTQRLRLILVSAMQVDRAVFFAALIVLAAFVPLFTMEGVEGAIFGPMARTYGYALAGALIATFTVTPVLASLLLPEHLVEAETLLVRALHRVYDPLLKFVLDSRRLFILAGMVVLGVAACLIPRLGSEFLPALEEGNFWIRASMPMTLSLQDGEAATRRMRQILRRYPEVVTVFSQHGRPDDGSDASPFSNVELFAVLRPQRQWRPGLTKDSLTQRINADFGRELPGVNFNFSQYIQDNIQEGISGVKAVNSVKIVGPNLQTLTRLAGQVREALGRVRGITDLGVFPVLGQPNLDIRIDRARSARFGLNTGDIDSVIAAASGGVSATTVLEGDRQFDLAVRYPAAWRSNIEQIGNIRVPVVAAGGGTNAYIPLKELAQLTLDTGAAWIYHEGNERFIPVKFSVRGRDLGGAVADAQAQVARSVRLPSGYRLVWAGEFGQLQAAKRRLAVVVPVSIVLILGLLYALFNSAKQCLLALLGVPFVMSGGVFALYAFGLNFSISAAIGFVSLFGVAVMIGILMINSFMQERDLGGSPREGLHRATRRVMRPLLMMSLSAGIGLLPAALSTGIGSEVQRPLAAVVVGGMLIGSLLLLVVVPAVYLALLARGTTDRQALQGPSTS
ncbi:MAG: efflux RND transporter permease subunit [Proteobacteria bacterium]|nr:efflux RND transporter permease subunit [Pseudomonadota bacterium]